MTDTPPDQDELVDALLDGGLRMLITTIVDNAGITRAKTVPAARLRTAVRDGIGLSPVFALMCTDDAIASSPAVNGPVGDMRLIPDLAAAAPVGVRGDVVWAPADQFDQEHRPMDICQRSALRRQEQRAVEAGLTVLLGLELEFTMFTGDPDDPRVAHIGPPYGVIPTLQLKDFARDLFDAFEAAGLMVEQLHPEYGRGQVEVALPPASPVAAVDQALLARMIIHRLAHRHGLLASFSPVTVAGAVGNGAHIHFSAATADAQFGDSEGQYGLSEHAQHLIAGVLAELDGLTGVLAPSVVSADRRVPGNWAGAFTCWGPENREAALRLVPGSITSRPASTNCEIKIGDPSANLYLAATAVLASALTGLQEKLPLPAPAERDPATYTEDERTRLGHPPPADHARGRAGSVGELVRTAGRAGRADPQHVPRRPAARCGLAGRAQSGRPGPRPPLALLRLAAGPADRLGSAAGQACSVGTDQVCGIACSPAVISGRCSRTM